MSAALYHPAVIALFPSNDLLVHGRGQGVEIVLRERSEAGRSDNRGMIPVVTLQCPRFERVLEFIVFEAKTFPSGAQGRGSREIVSAEPTADGKDDLAVLVHDKPLLCVQE